MEFLEITTPYSSEDTKLFTKIIDIGIDSRLEGFTESKFHAENNRYYFNFHFSELQILLRRLEEVNTEQADQWIYDIILFHFGEEVY